MDQSDDRSKISFLKSHIRDIPDFPKQGVVFKDITPLLTNFVARSLVLQTMVDQFKGKGIEAVAAIEARGFLFGTLLAQELQVPFVPIRKFGKLPYKKKVEHYDLEYGTSSIEIHEDAIMRNARILIHDDLLATGGTAMAAGALVKQVGGQVAGLSFIIDLTFLSGAINLERQFGVEPQSVLRY
jgi:adenine phosphoribosyltransferase